MIKNIKFTLCLIGGTTDFGSVGERGEPFCGHNNQSKRSWKYFLGAFFQEKEVLLGNKDVNDIINF